MEPNEIENVETPETEEPELTESLTEESDDDSLSLESVFADSEEKPANEGEDSSQGSSEPKEPGYVQRRINKAIAEMETKLRAEFEQKLAPYLELEQQMAPYREYMMETEAKELVRAGKVRDLETAKELVRYRQGQPQPTKQEEQPQPTKNAEQQNPVDAYKVEMLTRQANKIKEQRGIDVISEFQNNEDVKQKIISGEWDFYDVADAMQKSKKRVPAPMRSPNGASGAEKSTIANMTDEQFERFDKNVKGGARYSLR